MPTPNEIERQIQEAQIKKLLTNEQVLELFIKLARTHQWPAKK